MPGEMIKRKRGWFSLRLSWAIFLLLGISMGCGAKPQPTEVVLPAATLPPPSTSIILAYRTPAPTITETAAPTETPTPDPGINDLPDYYGGLVISMDYAGQTITLRPGTGFLLRLGESFNWTVTADPPDLLTPNRKVTLEPGEQAVYIARQKGKVVISAIGDPKCLLVNPPCTRPSVLFRLNVIIE